MREDVSDIFGRLSGGEREVMMQLFLFGPIWDGYIVSKAGRDRLCDLGLATHAMGWAFLTREGVRVAINADVRQWRDQRWHKKQMC